MEISLTNHQDVAEPDQVASGGAGTGLNHGIETGIAEHVCRKNGREFFMHGEYTRNLPARASPEGCFFPVNYGPVARMNRDRPGSMPVVTPAAGQSAGPTLYAVGSTTGLLPSSREKTRKNRLVIGLGIFSPGGMIPVIPRDPGPVPAVPAGVEWEEALIPSGSEQRERMCDRVTKKIERFTRRFTRFGERRRY